jgi:hypothetical protein
VGLALCLCLVASAGCRRDGRPVGRVEVAPQSLRLGYPEVRELSLAWEPLAPLSDRPVAPVVFLHLIDGEGRVVRTFDHPFPEAWRPRAPARYAVALYQSALAPPLPAGSYALTLGLYRPGGQRGPLETAAPPRGRHEYEVARVEVTAPGEGGAGAPRFDFTGAWEPPRAGTDIQVLTSRWLRGDGAIAVTGVPGAGRVWLAFTVPGTDDPAALLVLKGDAPGPAVMVTTTCGATMTSVSGPGRHTVAIPLDPAAVGEAGACEVRLAPTFYQVSTGTPVHRALLLEVVGWMPGRGEGSR